MAFKLYGTIEKLVSVIFRKSGFNVTVEPGTASANTIFSLPPANGDAALVSTDATQTLTNKTLTAPAISSPTGLVKGDVGLDNVDNTSDATKNAAAVSLTNKTIDADLNTITNIEDSDIKAAAAIAWTKLAAPANSDRVVTTFGGALSLAAAINPGVALISDANGLPAHSTVTTAELAYVSGVTSAIQTQLDSKASTTYVDNAVNGLSWKQPVRAASTANVVMTTDLESGDTIDGVTLATGDRVLLKDQSTASQNGIYVVKPSGPPDRSADMDSLSPLDEINGAACFVLEGTANADKAFVQTATVTTLGTDAVSFAQFSSASSYVGGTGITITGNSIATNDGQIVHDNLSGFVANEHIDHSSVSVSTAANSGLSGGGDITTTRSLVIDPSNATAIGGALAGTEEILVDDGALKKVTTQQIADLAAGTAAETFTWVNGSDTKTCSHSFGTLAVFVEIFDSANETVYIELVDRSDVNTVALTRSESTVDGNWTVIIRN
jgi:hypothetical protein